MSDQPEDVASALVIDLSTDSEEEEDDDHAVPDNAGEVPSDDNYDSFTDTPDESSDDSDDIGDAFGIEDPILPGVGEVPSLKDLSMTAVIESIKSSELPVSTLDSLTPELKADVVIALTRGCFWCESLEQALASAEIVLPALTVASRRAEMFHVFQIAIVHEGSKFLSALAKSVEDRLKSAAPDEAALHFREVAAMASTLLDSAWPNFAEVVLRHLLARFPVVGAGDEAGNVDHEVVVGAKVMLLGALTTQLKLTEAAELMDELGGLDVLNVDSTGTRDDSAKTAQLRAAFNMESARLHLERSAFKLAYSSAMSAVSCLREEHPVRLAVDVYRVASRACVMRRKFDVAKVFAREAFLLARDKLGPKHVARAEAAADLGFYWQGAGDRGKATLAYGMALEVLDEVFPGLNYHEARIRERMAHVELDLRTDDEFVWVFRDLAASGALGDGNEAEEDELDVELPINVFSNVWALQLLEEATLAMAHIWDNEWRLIVTEPHFEGCPHPLEAGCQRIDALVEMGHFDSVCRQNLRAFCKRGSAKELPVLPGRVGQIEAKLVSSLDAAERTFGESSLQTARHLDSLGYFYRKTLNLSLAETTLSRALSAKEALLDSDDPEVASTLRQLAVVHFLGREFDRAAQLFARCCAATPTATDSLVARTDDEFVIASYAKAENFHALQEWTQRYEEFKARTADAAWQPANPDIPQPESSGLDVGADAPQSLANVVEELKRLGALQ